MTADRQTAATKTPDAQTPADFADEHSQAVFTATARVLARAIGRQTFRELMHESYRGQTPAFSPAGTPADGRLPAGGKETRGDEDGDEH